MSIFPLNLLFNTVLELVAKSIRQERSQSENAVCCMSPTTGLPDRDRPTQLKRGGTVCIKMNSSSLSSSLTVDQNPPHGSAESYSLDHQRRPKSHMPQLKRSYMLQLRPREAKQTNIFLKISMGSSMVTSVPHSHKITNIGMMGERDMETLHTLYSVFL